MSNDATSLRFSLCGWGILCRWPWANDAVTSVEAGRPADKAGLKPRDMIVAYADGPVGVLLACELRGASIDCFSYRKHSKNARAILLINFRDIF
jgi:hypothetical protein